MAPVAGGKKKRRWRLRVIKKDARSTTLKGGVRHAIFVATGCYLTERDDARPRSRMELDMDMYCVGVGLSEEKLVSHARRHLIKVLHENWPKLHRRAVRTVFSCAPYYLMGELKQLIIKVARDRLAWSQNRPVEYLQWLGFLVQRKSPQKLRQLQSRGHREYYDMLQDELASHHWLIRGGCKDTSLNTWCEHERKFEKDILSLRDVLRGEVISVTIL